MQIIKREFPKIKTNGFKEWFLAMRGIPIDNWDSFFNPSFFNLHDNILLSNIEESGKLLLQHIKKNSKIAIYADTDCDGVTSVSTCYLYLSNFTNNLVILYHQRDDGHGVIPNNIPSDIDLLIIVDSSTNSVDECKLINEKGIDIIILDHHPKFKENPYALIVNPTMNNYPNSHLSGSATVYKFCSYFDSIMGVNHSDKYLDIVAVGLIADMMKLNELENRYIVYEGLKIIDNGFGNKGLLELYKRVVGENKATSESISFYISPCINGTIRLGDIYDTIRLFISNDDIEIKELVDKLIKANEDRKDLTDSIANYIKDNSLITNDKLIILDMTSANYNKNVFGLVANKICEEFGRPCLFGKVVDGNFVGSGRGFEIRKSLVDSGLFNWALGHESAFGCSFPINNLQEIKNYFNCKYKDSFIDKIYYYDSKLPTQKMTLDLLEDIDELSTVCGEGFEKPKFLISNIQPNYFNVMGKKKNHIKLTLSGEYYTNILKFNTSDDIKIYEKAKSIDVIGSVGVNSYFSKEKNKLYISKQVLSDVIIINEKR